MRIVASDILFEYRGKRWILEPNGTFWWYRAGGNWERLADVESVEIRRYVKLRNYYGE